MARLLLTGGVGYVDTRRIKMLTAAGHECVVYDKRSHGHGEAVHCNPLIEGDDVRDAKNRAQVIGAFAFDAVLHLAAFACVGKSVRVPDRYRAVYETEVHKAGS